MIGRSVTFLKKSIKEKCRKLCYKFSSVAKRVFVLVSGHRLTHFDSILERFVVVYIHLSLRVVVEDSIGLSVFGKIHIAL